MDVLVLIGRILFSAIFIASGYNHFVNGRAMAGYAAARGVPQPLAATYAGGALLAAGGLSVLLGVWADLGALLLVIFLVSTAVLMHPFWKSRDQERMMEMIQFQKDTALAGAALMLLAFFS
jgi:putative oxidoreductase